MAGRSTRVAGPLHNHVLSMELGGDAQAAKTPWRSTFHLYSTQHVEHGMERHSRGRDVVSSVSASSQQAQQAQHIVSPSKQQAARTASLTPSPQKQRTSQRGSKLVHWTLRLGQQVMSSGQEARSGEERKRSDTPCAARSSHDSSSTETESNAESLNAGRREQTKGQGATKSQPLSHSASPGADSRNGVQHVAWYSAVFDAEQADAQLVQQARGCDSWLDVEAHIKQAWEAGRVDVAVPQSRARSDGTFERVQVHFELASSGDSGQHGTESALRITVKLERLDERAELLEATRASVELMQALSALQSKAQHLAAEREHDRSFRDAGQKRRAKEASRSTTNVGRIRRKLVDDEGFEGEEE